MAEKSNATHVEAKCGNCCRYTEAAGVQIGSCDYWHRQVPEHDWCEQYSPGTFNRSDIPRSSS